MAGRLIGVRFIGAGYAALRRSKYVAMLITGQQLKAWFRRPKRTAGPYSVTVEYRIDPAKRDEFLALLHAGRATRRRDGAYAWGIYQDTDDPSVFVEEFLVQSWSEHQRQHVRVTKHDQSQEALARAFPVGPEEPRVRHYLFAERSRERSESSFRWGRRDAV